MAPKISQHQLLQELQNDNMFFDQLVDMIPAKLYVAGASGDDYNPKYYKGQAKENKEARRAISKQAKRAKLDPTLAETTTQAKKRMDGGRSLMPGVATTAVPVTPEPSAAAAEPSAAVAVVAAAPAMDNQSRIEALRDKLHAKLAEKRGNRPSDPNVVSKRAARRSEKKKRQEEAAKRKKSAHTVAEKAKGKNYKVSAEAAKNDLSSDLAQLDFGRLSGLNRTSNDQYQKNNKSLANMSKSNNLQKMLSDAESKRERLEELKHGNEEEKKKAANMEWGDAIKEASGDRVKDDPAKLKKALKRRDATKKKSAKAWKSRMEQTQQKMDDKQKIRNHNLNKRKDGGSAGANLSSKRINKEEDKSKANGGRPRLSRPGFEGRKQEFLNDKKGKGGKGGGKGKGGQ
jgi:hypothetical protein